ncbi:MAG: hypothetical protein ACJA08_002088 [Cyclobacteriaceae bacterium]|jgi:hypothetical protein
MEFHLIISAPMTLITMVHSLLAINIYTRMNFLTGREQREK